MQLGTAAEATVHYAAKMTINAAAVVARLTLIQTLSKNCRHVDWSGTSSQACLTILQPQERRSPATSQDNCRLVRGINSEFGAAASTQTPVVAPPQRI
jgi:hypothetical protein